MRAVPRLPDSVETIPAALAYWADVNADGPALIAPGGTVVSYAALSRGAEALAASLNRVGIGREDRVVILLPDGPRLALALLGTASAAVALPLDAALTPTELKGALAGFGAVAAIGDPSLSDAARACLEACGLPVIELVTDDRLETVSVRGHTRLPPRPRTAPQSEDIAFVNQTSGTTGSPKRSPRTHGSVLANGRAHRDRFGLDHTDRALAVAPIAVSIGRTALLHGLAAGSVLVFPTSFDAPALCQAIEDGRPTWMHAPAGVLELLADYLRAQPGRQVPESLRFVRVTAAAIAPRTCYELAERLGAVILPGYSTSELGLIATSLPTPTGLIPGSAGRPVRTLKIVDGEANCVAPGERGEIWVHAADFPGYLGAANQLELGGWFRTGDVGYLDGDGYLFLTGRLNELINRGGAKIAPAEVDDVLMAHPAVRAAAAFAVPDERLGEDIVAAVVLQPRSSATARALRSWMLDRLATHKAPRRIWFVDDLPRTSTGKVRRGELARRWGEQGG